MLIVANEYFMLSVANKHFMLIVLMLAVIMLSAVEPEHYLDGASSEGKVQLFS
jgi:hypothetical protein